VRVLVTGGAGFVGSHIADLLATGGHEPVVLDALLPEAHGRTMPAWTEAHPFLRGDVRDGELLSTLLPGVDAVCHQAAMVGHGLDPSDAPAYAGHNDLGTAVLLTAMHSAGVRRLVLASSMVIYGEGRYHCVEHGAVRPGDRRRADLDAGRYEPRCPRCERALTPGLLGEDARPDPRTTYATTKLAQEHLAAAWARQTGGAAWALRYHNVYGPRMPRDTPYAGVASIFRSALARGEPPQVLEDGRQRRDFVHVSDVARANLLALEAEAPTGRLVALNVCSGEPHTIGELATALATASGGPSPKVVGGSRPGDVRHIVADPTSAQQQLGFHANVGFAAGIRAFARAEQRQPATGRRQHRPSGHHAEAP
jgi:dTDP-L-rhamnose 4-epimerase